MSSAEATAEREHRRAHELLAGLNPEQADAVGVTVAGTLPS